MELRRWAEQLVQQNATSLLDAGLTEEDALLHLRRSIPTVLRWMSRFLAPVRGPRHVLSAGYDQKTRQEMRRGLTVEDVVDVEEAIWAPKYGLKGMIDATVMLSLEESDGQAKTEQQLPSEPFLVAPLEIKTGRPHGSHRAQVLLYLLLLEERFNDQSIDWGVLWLTGETDPTLVRRTHGELAALLATRNKYGCGCCTKMEASTNKLL